MGKHGKYRSRTTGFDLEAEKIARQARCSEDLDGIQIVNSGELSAHKAWMHERLKQLFVVEVNRDAALIAFYWLVFSLYAAACLAAIPLGLAVWDAGPATRAPLAVVWLGTAILLFLVLQKLFLPGFRTDLTLVACFLIVAGGAITGLFSPDLWQGFQVLFLRAADDAGRHLTYILILTAALVATMIIIIPAWKRLRIGNLMKMILLFLAPIAVFALAVAVGDAAGLGSPVLRDNLRRYGAAVTLAFGASLVCFVAGGAFLYYLFERYKGSRYPDLVILEDLLTVAYYLGNRDCDWRDLRIRKQVVRKIESVAERIQFDLPGQMPTTDRRTGQLAGTAFARIAYHFRSLALQAMIPEAGTRKDLLRQVGEILLHLARGDWDAWPRLEEGDLPPGKSWKERWMYLAVAFIPILILGALQGADSLTESSLFDAGHMKFLMPGAYLWAAVSLGVTFDPLFGSKLAVLREFVDILRRKSG